MSWLGYREGVLCTEGIPLPDLAAKFGTPCYVYSATQIQENIRVFQQAFSGLPLELFYAVKANSNGAILHLFSREGLGAEVVSGGELLRALRAGFPGERIILTGVGKTPEELKLALDHKVRAIVVESLGELALLSELAPGRNRRVPVALRLHPALEPDTHPHLATGLVGSKFGLDPKAMGDALRYISRTRDLLLVGLHVHLGSQISSAMPYLAALEKLVPFTVEARSLGLDPDFLDLGGGFSIPYEEGETRFPLEELAQALPSRLPEGLSLVLEPGRALVGDAGILLTRILYRKRVHDKNFVVVDAGMNDLLRPSLYGACHRILPAQERLGTEKVDVVGPICENADFIAKDYPLPPMEPGELLAVLDTGAYGFVMSSQYNSRPRAAEVLLLWGTPHPVRRRETWDDLWRGEEVPPCLT